MTATTISDGSFSRPLDANFVRNAPLADVQQALRDASLPTDRVEVPFTPLLVDVGGQRVLFDVGNGEFGAATAGKLLENMAKAGISPDSVTAVVFSHFHGDHINGLRNKAGQIAFPKARLYVPAPEWDWWMDDARMNAAPEAARGGFAAVRRVFGPVASQLVRFQPGQEVPPGVRPLAAYGYTAGYTRFYDRRGPRSSLPPTSPPLPSKSPPPTQLRLPAITSTALPSARSACGARAMSSSLGRARSVPAMDRTTPDR